MTIEGLGSNQGGGSWVAIRGNAMASLRAMDLRTSPQVTRHSSQLTAHSSQLTAHRSGHTHTPRHVPLGVASTLPSHPSMGIVSVISALSQSLYSDSAQRPMSSSLACTAEAWWRQCYYRLEHCKLGIKPASIRSQGGHRAP